MKVYHIDIYDGLRIGVLEWVPRKQSYEFPILLVHGFAQNNLSWHGKSGGLATTLCEKGFHVFSVDLRGSGYSKIRKLYYTYTFDDLVFKDICYSVDFIRSKTKKELVLLGHSLGGICCYVFSAFFPESVKAIITFGSPVEFGKNNRYMRFLAKIAKKLGLFSPDSLVYYVWPREFGVKVLGFIGLFGVPLMRYKTLLELTPLYPSYVRNFESVWDLWEKLIMGFEFSSPKLFVQILRWVDEGGITSFRGLVDYTERLREINAPLFAAAGKLDKIAPPESVKPIVDIVSSPVKIYKEYEVGHIDLVEGKVAKNKIADDVEKFLRDLEIQ